MSKKSVLSSLISIVLFGFASVALAAPAASNSCDCSNNGHYYIPPTPKPSGYYIGIDGDMSAIGQYIAGTTSHVGNIPWSAFQGYKFNPT